MDDSAFNPIVERPQALDLAFRHSFFTAELLDIIVMVLDMIQTAVRRSNQLEVEWEVNTTLCNILKG